MSGVIQIKARHWFLLFTAAILCLSLAVTGRIYPVSASQSGAPESFTGRLIIIDPGHGGFDGGAVGVSGTVEKDVNLAVSLKLRDMLTDAGFDVIMTRDTDRALNDSEDTTIRKKKISDMRNRLNLVNQHPGAVLVSIHQNKLSGGESVYGGQIFYSPNEPSGRELAECIQARFNEELHPEKPRETVKTGKNLYLFSHAEIPAVLCECGFLSNTREEALLATDEYQYKVAYCIYSGLIIWNQQSKEK